MMEYNGQISGVLVGAAVEKALYSFDILFEYSVPAALENEAAAGKRIIVPFGNGSKKCVGMIMYVRNGEFDPRKTKRLISIIDSEPVLDGEMLALAQWLKENTFCTYYDAVKTIIPAGLGIDLTEQFRLNPKFRLLDLTSDERTLCEAISKVTAREADELIKELLKNNKDIFRSLSEKKAVIGTDGAKSRFAGEKISMRCLALSDESLAKLTLTPKQRQVTEMLAETGAASVREICYTCNVTSAVIANLVKKGVLDEFENTVSHSVTKDNEATMSPSDIVFSKAQQTVFDGLCKLMNENTARCALLRGITGSGKTSVFIKLIEKALQQGKTALMLVPEIALTPQMTGNFIKLFGNKVAIIHSGLSLGQKTDEYKRIKNGEAAIVIGTRSAVFAPLQNIGIIVIDEEGEHTYKSDRTPRYHARNVAKQRAFYHKSLLLLASATPSLDSSYQAARGKYSLFELNERYSTAVLPDVYIVDMKIEAEGGNRSNFSLTLLEELKLNLEKGEQSLILLNRRGYHTYANCIKCGTVVDCPNCGVALTYHKANETFRCHYCGYGKPTPKTCEKCGSKYIYQSGTGTQRIEDELREHFPKARILRMDADTTMTKNAFERNFALFADKEYDIMVGTQMIAKGLDFENVTLVGVLLIDKMLYSGDYIGYERVFSLVTQVVGRSGRGGKQGRAYLQTFTPDHYVLELASRQNYSEFFKQELEVRKALVFPPICDLFIACFSSEVEKKAETAAERFIQLFAELFEEHLKGRSVKMPLRVLGPTKGGVGRINGKYRYKVIIKAKNNAVMRELISALLIKAYNDTAFKGVGFYIDINGEIP